MTKRIYLNFNFLIVSILLASCKTEIDSVDPAIDIVLIGGGIMSASVSNLLHELDPDLRIEIFERLQDVALESSQAWNNAGTGHAGYCELNYTPERADGSIDTKKAIETAEAFELSKQFWAYQLQQNEMLKASTFINQVPHMSFVWGDKNVAFLKKRFEALKVHPLFMSMEYSEDPETIRNWAPLIVEGRENRKIAATRIMSGADVDFGELAKILFAPLKSANPKNFHLGYEVYGFEKDKDGYWRVYAKDLQTRRKKVVKTRHIFIGAGGAALPLLQKTQIPEGRPFAGFPVGGEWLVTDNPKLVEAHLAKVYGLPSVGAPPMSVPHLDTRFIDGKRFLLFGPFALFSTKFLKQGSWFDILASFRLHNILPMLQAGWHNIPLTHYLVSQVLQSKEQKIESLKEYFPNADPKDWKPLAAGQRVQIIKKDPDKGGILQFGTEVVASKNGSVVALLGASPGASVSVQIALSVIEKSFSEQMQSLQWRNKLNEMIPSYGKELSRDPKLLKMVRERNIKYLGIP